MTTEHWQDPNARCLGLLLDGRAQVSGIPRRGSEATLLLIVNAHHDVVVFKLPEVTGGRDWVRLIDTNLPEEDDDPEEPTRLAFGHHYEVTGRSLLLFLARPARAARPTQARAPGARRDTGRRMMPAQLPDAASPGQAAFWASGVSRRLGRGGAAVVLALAASAAANYALAKRAERRNPPQGNFVTVDGVRLHYLEGPAEHGGRPAIVLLHGVGAMTGEMTASGIVDALAADHRVIVFDRPGFGYSERPRGRIWTPGGAGGAAAPGARPAGGGAAGHRRAFLGHARHARNGAARPGPDRRDRAAVRLLFPDISPRRAAAVLAGGADRRRRAALRGLALARPAVEAAALQMAVRAGAGDIVLCGRGSERADLPPLAPPIGRGRGGAADPGRGRSGREVSRIAAADRDRRGSGRPGHRFRAPLGTTVSGAAAQHAARAAPHRTHDPPFRARRDSGRDPRHGPRDASEGGGERMANRDRGETGTAALAGGAVRFRLRRFPWEPQ